VEEQNKALRNRWAHLQAASAEGLAEFLRTDLELGFTFADLAKTERQLGSVEGFERNKRNAAQALDAVRAFEKRLTDDGIRRDIKERCAELERMLATL
jgi:hypothetical protein